jgi:hypothetical protein
MPRNKSAEKICEALRIQGRKFAITENRIESGGLTFCIEPTLESDEPTRIWLTFPPMDSEEGRDNALYPALFMTDHFGKNCEPTKLIAKSVEALRAGAEYIEQIGDWTFRLSRKDNLFLLEVS